MASDVAREADGEGAGGVCFDFIDEVVDGFDDADVSADESVLVTGFGSGEDFVGVSAFGEAAAGDDEDVVFLSGSGFLDVEGDGVCVAFDVDKAGECDAVEGDGLGCGVIAECPALSPRDVFDGGPVFRNAEEVKHEFGLSCLACGWVCLRC